MKFLIFLCRIVLVWLAIGAVNMIMGMILYELGDYDGGAFPYPWGFIVTIGYVVVGCWVWAFSRLFKRD